MPTEALPSGELETLVGEYLQAFDERSVERCMSYYTEDSSLEFVSMFRGLKEIEEWHKARFAADLRLVRLDKISVSENAVAIDAVATSKRLRAWRVKAISGSIRAVFEGDKIKDLKFAIRAGG